MRAEHANVGRGLWLRWVLANIVGWAVGWTLFLVGALSTIPLALEIFGGHRLSASEEEWREQTASAPRSETNQRRPGAFAQT